MNDNKTIAKNYAKLHKWKFEGISGDLFVISKICKRRVNKVDGIPFKDWKILKYKTYDILKIHNDEDCQTIKSNVIRTEISKGLIIHK